MKSEYKRTNYPNDLSDRQWEKIAGFFPSGNKSKCYKRNLLEAVMYAVKTGCQNYFISRDIAVNQIGFYDSTGTEQVIPSVKVVGAGNIKRKLTIKNIGDNPVLTSIPGITGELYDFYHEENLRLKSAVISFALSEELLENIDINKLQIAYFNTENGDIEFLDTYVSGNEIYANTDHLCAFIIVDSDGLKSVIQEDLASSFEENVILNEKYNTVWGEYNNHTYAYIDDLTVGGLDWGTANEFAKQQGGHLVTITSDGEQKFETELVANGGTKSTYWIGLTSDNKDNQWEWVTGEKFSYTHWGKGEPNSKSEKWVHMVNTNAAPYPKGSWNDTQYNYNAGGGWYSNSNCGLIIEWDAPINFDDTNGNTIRLSNFKKVTLNKDPKLGDRSIDTDNDGLCDLDELICPTIKTVDGIPVEVWLFSSDPTLNDSDGDGYADGPIDSLKNGKYNDPNRMICDVFVYKLNDSDNFVPVYDASGNQYYGGNQSWILDYNFDNKDIYASGGCAVSAACDLILYLKRTNKDFSCVINFDEPGITNFNYITKDQYVELFNYVASNYVKPINFLENKENLEQSIIDSFIGINSDWGKTPIVNNFYRSKLFISSLSYKILEIITYSKYTWGVPQWEFSADIKEICKSLNISRANLFALWFSYNQPILAINLNDPTSINDTWKDKIQNGIIDSLERDIPVTLAYGIGGKFDFHDWEDPSTVRDERITGGHYINVTEFVVDKIAQDEYMKIATWGKSYYLKYDSFMEHFGIGGSVFFYAIT